MSDLDQAWDQFAQEERKKEHRKKIRKNILILLMHIIVIPLLYFAIYTIDHYPVYYGNSNPVDSYGELRSGALKNWKLFLPDEDPFGEGEFNYQLHMSNQSRHAEAMGYSCSGTVDCEGVPISISVTFDTSRPRRTPEESDRQLYQGLWISQGREQYTTAEQGAARVYTLSFYTDMDQFYPFIAKATFYEDTLVGRAPETIDAAVEERLMEITAAFADAYILWCEDFGLQIGEFVA